MFQRRKNNRAKKKNKGLSALSRINSENVIKVFNIEYEIKMYVSQLIYKTNTRKL